MNKRFYFFILLVLAAYGCGGSQGSSSVETVNDGSMASSVMEGVTLMGSKQGQSGGFVDVDGDGIDDKVVGAPYATTDSAIGAVLVYKGDSTGGFSSAPTLVLTGDDNFGYSFANIGDVDGDGKSDFAIGAISGSGDSDGDGVDDVSLSGSVTVFKGGGNGQVIRKIAGDEAMDKFGVSLAAGDLNGDGYPDLIVGAPFNTPSASFYQQGAVYIYWGNSSTDTDFTTRTKISASSSISGLGWAVATGNVNNDSYSDLVIAAGRKALVFYGGSTFDTAADLTIDAYNSGDKTSDTFKSLAVVDLDGDGKGEVVAGAPNATVNSTSNVGTVVIVKGTATGTVTVGTAQVPQAPASLIARINGTSLFDRFGASFAVVPNMESSETPALSELVVGATTANDYGTNYLSGRVYLFKSGSRSGSTWTASSVFNGTTKDQSYGYFLAPAGGTKLLIGAPRSNMDTGGVSMVDLATGEVVAGGSSGGGGGGGGDCHAPKFETDTED